MNDFLGRLSLLTLGSLGASRDKGALILLGVLCNFFTLVFVEVFIKISLF